MSKEEKRTYHAEAAAPSALRLTPRPERRGQPAAQRGDTATLPRGQFFSPEMIRRLAERIRKL